MRQKFNLQMSRPPQKSQTPFAARLVFVAQRSLLVDGDLFSFDSAEFGTERAAEADGVGVKGAVFIRLEIFRTRRPRGLAEVRQHALASQLIRHQVAGE